VKKLQLQVMEDVVDFGLSQEDPGRRPPRAPTLCTPSTPVKNQTLLEEH
jgi:hypothetical protein